MSTLNFSGLWSTMTEGWSMLGSGTSKVLSRYATLPFRMPRWARILSWWGTTPQRFDSKDPPWKRPSASRASLRPIRKTVDTDLMYRFFTPEEAPAA